MKLFGLLCVVTSLGCAVASEPVDSQSSDLQTAPSMDVGQHSLPNTPVNVTNPCFFQDRYLLITAPISACINQVPENSIVSDPPGSPTKDPYGMAILGSPLDNCHLVNSQNISYNKECTVLNEFRCTNGKLDRNGNILMWNYRSVVSYDSHGNGSGMAEADYDPVTNRSDCWYAIESSPL